MYGFHQWEETLPTNNTVGVHVCTVLVNKAQVNYCVDDCPGKLYQ